MTFSPLDQRFPLPSLRNLVREMGWHVVRNGSMFAIKSRSYKCTYVIRKTERAALRAALVNYGPFYSTAR
jgi:hypothetical protein